MLPTWMYSKSPDAQFVCEHVCREHGKRGGRGRDKGGDGTDDGLSVGWKCGDHGESGRTQTRTFPVKVRVPTRNISVLYLPTPSVRGLKSLTVNGAAVTPIMEKGYAVITREWKARG